MASIAWELLLRPSMLENLLSLVLGPMAWPLPTPLPALAGRDNVDGDISGAYSVLGLGGGGIVGTELATALAPAFHSQRLASRSASGEVLLVDAWSEPKEVFAEPDTRPTSMACPYGQALLEAYLAWESPCGLGKGLIEGLVSLYALVVFCGVDAHLIVLCLPDEARPLPEPSLGQLESYLLGSGEGLLSRVAVLCPPRLLIRGGASSLGAGWPWNRARG